VPYRINENCPDCTGEGTAVQNAAATWSNADAEFSFSYAGSTAATAVGYDGVNEVMWNNTIPVGIVARCWWWHYGSTTVESDIEFNDDYLWSASPTCPTGRFDVESVALHELGHTVGLADLYSGDTSRVMYGIIDYGQIKRTLHPDDIAGIQALYGTLIPAIPALNTPLNKATVADLEPTLTWNASSKADDYGLQVANEPGFTAPFVNEIGRTSLNYNLTGLNWNTNYYWRVNAHNSYGTSAWSAQRYFMTPLGPPPTDLTGTPISSSRIDLGWTDTTTGEAGFMIERKKGAAGTYALVATVGPDVTSYSNASGLLPSTEYYYRVRAYLSTKYTGYSNDTSATTLPPPPPVPTLTSPPSNAIVPGLTATLSWNPSTGAEDYGLQVSRNYTFASLVVSQTDIAATSYDAGGLDPGTMYYWRVNAQNSSGSTSRWSAYRYFRTAAGP